MKTTTKTFVSLALLTAAVAFAQSEVWNRSTTERNAGEYIHTAVPELPADATFVESTDGKLSTQPWTTVGDPNAGSRVFPDPVRSEGGLILFSTGQK